MSADSQQQRPQRSSERFSIDLSLELEQQLEHMESPSNPDPDSNPKRDSLEARKKTKEDEEAITMLRSKVEESRQVAFPSAIWRTPRVDVSLSPPLIFWIDED